MIWRVAQGLVVVVLAGSTRANADPVQENPPSQPAAPVAPATPLATMGAPGGVAAQAMQHAADANKYLFIFFYKEEDDATQAARKTFEEATSKLAEKAEAVGVNAGDGAESAVVNRFGLGRAPMPLVLAIGPSGAVTRSFTRNFNERQLRNAFVSQSNEKSLKALQDRKMVFVVVQNGITRHNEEALQGVREFAADPQYTRQTEIVVLDPQDAAEVSFLKQLQVDRQTTEAITVFVAPPGTIIGTYTGATQKYALVAAAKKAAAGCGTGKPGCCPLKKPTDSPSSPAPQPNPTQKKP